MEKNENLSRQFNSTEKVKSLDKANMKINNKAGK